VEGDCTHWTPFAIGVPGAEDDLDAEQNGLAAINVEQLLTQREDRLAALEVLA
jgi:hypothetical protein